MNKKSASFISLFTVLFMLFTVFSPVSYGVEPDYYNLQVGGVLVTPANKDNIPITKGKAEYNPETNELHLTDATINGYNVINGSDICAIYTEAKMLNISFTGDCVIDLSAAPKNYPYGEAIYMNYTQSHAIASLYLGQYYGSNAMYHGKSLKIIGPDVNTGYGIYCSGASEVYIYNTDTTVTIEGNKNCVSSCGIKCRDLLLGQGISNISGSAGAFSGVELVDYFKNQLLVSGSKYEKEYDTKCDNVGSIPDFWKNWKNITIRPLVDDSNFLKYINEKLMGYDSDGNKALDADERARITEISLNATSSARYLASIENLNGIERFPNLQKFTINQNTALKSLNLSKNKKLTDLNCTRCSELESLDVSNNTELVKLDCSNSVITKLDLSNNTKLEELSCSYCKLTDLDLSENTKLKQLYCAGDYSLGQNILGSLDVSACPLLEVLNCNSCSIKTLKLGSKENLEELNCSAILSKIGEGLTSLDLSQCHNLKKLDCILNSLSNLDISKCPLLTELNANYNQLKSLNVSKNPELTKLSVEGNFNSLDLSKNTKLTSLVLHSANIKSLDLSALPELETLEITGTTVSSLNTSKNSKLVKLVADDNANLTSLNVSNNEKLQSLSCTDCSLTNLILGKHDSLEKFYCTGNKLKAIDISGLPLGKEKTSYGSPYIYQMGNQKDNTTISVYTISGRVDNIMYWLNTGAINSFNLKVSTLSLTAPKIKSVSDTGSGAKVVWSLINAPVKYRIYRSLSKDSGYSLISTVYNASSYTDKSVAKGKDYYYKVAAVTALGKTKESSPVKVHIHKDTTKVTKATLTKNGKTETKCSVCGKVIKTATVYYPKTIKLSYTSYRYDGKVKKPTVSVKDSNGKTVSSDNYTVTYASGRKSIGTYKVTVKFKGNYYGTKTLKFKIIPKKPTVTLTAGSKKATVSYKKVAGNVKYQIEYSTKKSSGYKNIKTSTTTLKTVKTGLTKGKTYYFRVRAFKKVGTTTYSSGWVTKSVKVQ